MQVVAQQLSVAPIDQGLTGLLSLIIAIALGLPALFGQLPEKRRTPGMAALFALIGAIIIGVVIVVSSTSREWSTPIVAVVIICAVVSIIFILVASARSAYRIKRKENFDNVIGLLGVLTSMLNGLYISLSRNEKQSGMYPNNTFFRPTLIKMVEYLQRATDVNRLRISLLKCLPNGKFRVMCEINLDMGKVQEMERKFRWKEPIKSIAGICAAEVRPVLCLDIHRDKNILNKWAPLEGDPKPIEGCILCVPVKWPKTFPVGVNSPPCIGVLSISSSQVKALNQDVQDLIEEAYIPVLLNLLLMHHYHEI